MSGGRMILAAKSTTVSAARASQIVAQVTKCGVATTPACEAAYHAKISVIDCAPGLTSNGACSFARIVQIAYATADADTGRPPSALAHVGSYANPMTCTGIATAWRCRSEVGSGDVWVAYHR